MIRRFFLVLLVLLGFVAFGAMLPAAPLAAAPMTMTMTMTMHHHTMPPGHCGDEGQAAAHLCLGCAVDPAQPSRVEPASPVAMPAPVASLASILTDHRPGFDPPPPRAA